jgi:hypothetical protein
MPTNYDPPPVYHTPTGDVTGVWSSSTGWHQPYKSSAPAMSSSYAGQTRAYNPSSKTWEEMVWVDGAGYMSPYQMKGILEGTIAYKGDINVIKKAYAGTGGKLTPPPKPEEKVLGYDDPYLQQSVMFKTPLSQKDAQSELLKVYERNRQDQIDKTRGTLLAEGYNTAVVNPSTPVALRQAEIQRQTTKVSPDIYKSK